MREMAVSIAETNGGDTAMSATSMLSAVSYCFTSKYRMQGKPDHTETSAIYSLIIANPSERKSPVVKLIKKPFEDFEVKYNKDHSKEFHKNEADRKMLLNKADKLEKDGNEDTKYIGRGNL